MRSFMGDMRRDGNYSTEEQFMYSLWDKNNAVKGMQIRRCRTVLHKNK